MQRREFLKYTGGLASVLLVDGVLAKSLWIPSAHGASIPLQSLYDSLDPAHGTILVPGDKSFESTKSACNLRTVLTPTVRVLCKTAEAVSVCVQWATQNNVPLAMRAGGHSYEGFSQSTGLVIDTRLMNDITLTSNNSNVQMGSGALLGQVYKKLSTKGKALPAGSCPTVGVTGHTTGGGYGLLARPLGLACDSLLSIEMVNAEGQIITANAQQNADLFWACRGGGGGSFGIITQLLFKTHDVATVTTFSVRWTVKQSQAKLLLKAWQNWAPNASASITSLMRFTKNQSGTINVACVGQTVGKASTIKSDIKSYLLSQVSGAKESYSTIPWIDAVKKFAGADLDAPAPAIYMKGKSDYVTSVTSDNGMNDIFANIPAGIAVIFDSYGGRIRDLSDTDTAFAHRSNTLSSVQYYAQWENPASTKAKLQTMKDYYNSLRSHFSGYAYVNYCDLDIKDYGPAYWGKNFNTLIDVKTAHDPKNFFRHAQSIPVR